MGFFSAAEMAGFTAMADSARDKPAVVYRPDYAGSASPTAVATVTCRVVRYIGGGANLLDPTGDATHTLHLPAGTDVKDGDEVLVNGSRRYAVIVTDSGRSYDYEVQAAVKRIA